MAARPGPPGGLLPGTKDQPPSSSPGPKTAAGLQSPFRRGAEEPGGLLSQALKAPKSPGGLLSNLLPPTPRRRQSSEGAARGLMQECSQPLGGDAGQRGPLAKAGRGRLDKGSESNQKPLHPALLGSLSPGFWYRIPVTQPQMGTKVPLAYGITFQQEDSFPQY